MSRFTRQLAVRTLAASLGLGGVALALLAVEGVVRATLPWRNPMRLFVQSPFVTFTVESAANVAEYDPELLYRLRPNQREAHWAWTRFNTNAQGMRRGSDIGPKTPGTIRIACLGDSCTFGFGVPHISFSAETRPSDRPYTDTLEETLRAAFPGKKIEVLNFAVPGYSSRHGTFLLPRVLREYQPDFVTSAFLTNDMVDPGASERMTGAFTPWQWSQRYLAGHSQALVHLLRWQQRMNPRSTSRPSLDTSRTTLEDFLIHHEIMRRLCEKAGVHYTILNPIFRDAEPGQSCFPPTRIHQFRAAMNGYIAASGVPMIQIPEITEALWPDNAPLFLERIHPNAAGHDLIAERMHEYFAPLISQHP